MPVSLDRWRMFIAVGEHGGFAPPVLAFAGRLGRAVAAAPETA